MAGRWQAPSGTTTISYPLFVFEAQNTTSINQAFHHVYSQGKPHRCLFVPLSRRSVRRQEGPQGMFWNDC